MRRRDFFAVLGGGIVVLLVDDSDAQESGGGARRGTNQAAPRRRSSAWLHIGEDGAVTVYTGKVEVGQNIRTSLTQAVAEELRAPVASITMVMADTALTPFDMGTFGSQTTPRMWPQIRKAAAAAREMLLDLAAAAVERGRGDADGRGRQGDVGQPAAAGFGELTKGQKLTQTIPTSAAADAGDGVEGRRARRCRRSDGRDDRDRRAPVHVRHEAAGHAVRQGAVPAGVRRDAAHRWTARRRRRCRA